MTTGNTGRVIAIIPARGGSKGVPHKNLRPLAGKPLVAWSVRQAFAAQSVDHVVVSSDSAEIRAAAQKEARLAAYADIYERAEFTLVDRPPQLAADDSTTESALLHALAKIGARDEDLIVLLQPTSPIRRPGAIDEAIHGLREAGADSLFSACPVEGFVWFVRDNGWEPTYDPVRRERRQIATPKLEENGSIYVFQASVLRETGSRLGGKIAAYVMHKLDSFQVDEPADLELMEQLLPLLLPAEFSPAYPH